MSKKILLVSLLLLFSLVGIKNFNPVTAGNHLKIQNIKSNMNSVSITWNTTLGESVKLTDSENKILYEGNSSTFKIKNLEEDTSYEWFLTTESKDGESLETLIIKTHTVPKKKDINVASLEKKEQNKELMKYAQIHAVVSLDEVTLFWENMPKNKGSFEIFKDNKSIGKFEGNKFTDSNISPDKTIVYRIDSLKTFSKEEKEKTLDKVKKLGVKIPSEVKNKDLVDEFSLIKIVKTPKEDGLNSASAATSYTTPGYALVYSTFIPSEYVPNPVNLVELIPGISHKFPHYFNGNNRGYGFWKPWRSCTKYYKNGCLQDNVKTRTIATVEFLSSGPKYTWRDPLIGKTKAYDKNLNLIKSAYDKPSISQFTTYKSSDRVSWHVLHNSNNPLAFYLGDGFGMNPDLSAGITYTYDATIYKSGDFKMIGQHDLAPNHEIYLSTYPAGPDSYISLYKRDIKSFYHLFPKVFGKGYEQATIKVQ